MNNLKNIASSVVNDNSAGKVKYYFDGKEHPFVQLNASGAVNDSDAEIVLKGDINKPIRELVGLFDASDGGTSWSVDGSWKNPEPRYALDASAIWNGAKEITKDTFVSTGGYIIRHAELVEVKGKLSKVFYPSKGEYEANPVVSDMIANLCDNYIWSRSLWGADGNGYYYAWDAFIFNTSDTFSSNGSSSAFAAVPAFNLNFENILMTRNATSGKNAKPSIQILENNDIKIRRVKFVAFKELVNKEHLTISVNADSSNFLKFLLNINCDLDAQWISATIINSSEEIIRYGVIGTVSDSELLADISDLANGSIYTIKLYTEQRNNAYYTDYVDEIFSYTFVIDDNACIHEVENVQIDLSSLHAGDFVYCRRKDRITKAVVLSSGPDAAMLVYVDDLWLNGSYRSSYTYTQKYMLTKNTPEKWYMSLDDIPH